MEPDEIRQMIEIEAAADAAISAGALQPGEVDAPFDVTAEPDVESAFEQVQPVVFDNELPWTQDNGRIKNRFGVVIARFDNWEQCDAVVATMNATNELIQAAQAINAASLPPAPPEPAAPMHDDKLDGLAYQGIPLNVNPEFLADIRRSQREMDQTAREIRRAHDRSLKSPTLTGIVIWSPGMMGIQNMDPRAGGSFGNAP